MVDINDIRLYKSTNTKKYSAIVYMPPTGTLINEEITTKDKPFVVVEPDMNTKVCNYEYIKCRYELCGGKTISEDDIMSRVRTAVHKNSGKTIKAIAPFKVESKVGSHALALQVPIDMTFEMRDFRGNTVIVNKPPCNCGDYLVCECDEHNKNINNLFVVSNRLFPIMYNMKNFSNLSRSQERKGLQPTKINAIGLEGLTFIKERQEHRSKRLVSSIETIYESDIKRFNKMIKLAQQELRSCSMSYKLIENTKFIKLNQSNQLEAHKILKSFEISYRSKIAEIQLIIISNKLNYRFRMRTKYKITNCDIDSFKDGLYWLIDALLYDN